MLPKVLQMELKIEEKSIPKRVLEEFGETLIFDDSIMVLLDYSVSRDPKIHEKSIQKSTLKKYLQKSLQNRRPDRFFCEKQRNRRQK